MVTRKRPVGKRKSCPEPTIGHTVLTTSWNVGWRTSTRRTLPRLKRSQSIATSTCRNTLQALATYLTLERNSGSPSQTIGLCWTSGQVLRRWLLPSWLKAQDGQSIGASAKPLLNYIGIERSKEMREKAKTVARESGLFHKDSDFGFGKSFDDANGIFSQVDVASQAIEIDAPTLVLNFSYFFSSKFLNVRDVSTFATKLRSRYA